MTVINHKSISGITSITTPAGSDNLLTVHTNNQTERFRIATDGKVGINTNILTEQLEVDGDIRVRNALKIRTPAGTENAVIALVDNDEFSLESYGTNGYFTFNVGSSLSEALRITTAGKLGINWGSPSTIIHAIGNGTVGTSVTCRLQTHDTANATANIELSARRNDNVAQMCRIRAASGGTNNVDLQFHTNNTEKLRITSGGSVGIGTVGPDSKLHVHSGSVRVTNTAKTNIVELSTDGNIEVRRTGGSAYIDFSDNTTNDADCRIQHVSDGFEFSTGGQGSRTTRLSIASDGNVTIGNDGDSGGAPSAGYDELVIEGGNENIGMCFLSPAANNVTQQISFGDSNNNQSGRIIYNHASDYMSLGVGGGADNERLRLTSTGNLLLNERASFLGANTSDGSDNKYIALSGGGAVSQSRGACVVAYGNEDSGFPGRLSLQAGNNNNSNAIIKFNTGGLQRMHITHTGQVLIGDGATYSPNGLLHLVGDTNSNGPELYLQVNNNNTTDNIGALWFGNNVDKSLVKLAGHTHTANNTSDFTVSTSNGGTLNEAIRITKDGDLLVGTTATGYRLNVREDLNSGGNLVYFGNSDGTYSQSYVLSFNNSKDIIWTGGSGAGGLTWDVGTRGYRWLVGNGEVATLDNDGDFTCRQMYGQLHLAATGGHGFGSWISTAYGGITNSKVLSYNDFLFAQNMRGYIPGIDGGTNNNNYYHTSSHSSMGYAGVEVCYGGRIRFYTKGSYSTTANATFTPQEAFVIGPTSTSSYHEHFWLQGAGETRFLIGSTGGNGAAIYFDGDSNGDVAGADYSWIRHTTSGDMEYVVDNPAAAGKHIFKTGSSKEVLRLNHTGEGDRFDFKVTSYQIPSLTNGNYTKVMATAGSAPAVGDAGYYILVFQGFEQAQTGGTQWSVSMVSPPVYIHNSNGNDGESTIIPLRANGHANSGGTSGEPFSCRLVWRGSSSHTPGEIQLRPNGFNYTGTNAYCYAYKIIQR